MDNTTANRNVPDPRNWQGSGNRSVTNMFIDLGIGVQLSDEQFLEQMEERRQAIGWRLGDHVIGCPLCAYDDLTIADVSDEDEAEDDAEEGTAETAETVAQQQ